MLRKSDSAPAGRPAADHTTDTTGGNRSWAAMRARLRQGREPTFGTAAVEPPPPAHPAPAGREGNRASAPASPGKPAEPARAHGRSAPEQDAGAAIREDAKRNDEPTAADPRQVHQDHQPTSGATPPANGADRKAAGGGNGAAHGAEFRPHAGQ